MNRAEEFRAACLAQGFTSDSTLFGAVAVFKQDFCVKVYFHRPVPLVLDGFSCKEESVDLPIPELVQHVSNILDKNIQQYGTQK